MRESIFQHVGIVCDPPGLEPTMQKPKVCSTERTRLIAGFLFGRPTLAKASGDTMTTEHVVQSDPHMVSKSGRAIRSFRQERLHVVARRILTLMVLMLSLMHGKVFAYSCTGPASAISYTLLPGPYAVPRDVPVGARITPWMVNQMMSTSIWTCNFDPYIDVGPVYQSTLPPSGQTYQEGGVTFPVYQTNLQGIGLIIGVSSYNKSGWSWNLFPQIPDGSGLSTSWTSAGTIENSGTSTGWTFGSAASFAFVKTGPIVGGTVNLPAVIGQAGMDSRPVTTPSNLAPMILTGNPVFSVEACATPSKTVNLGVHATSELSGAGSFTGATKFSIDLNDCSSGLGQYGPPIQYEIDPNTAVADSANSVVALDGTSTATGVGVQLLDGNGNALPLGKPITYTGGYNAASGGSYSIPLQARYYQTATTLGAGRANTAVTFTMTYL